MDQNTIHLGVIGCGEWGPNHIRNFQAQPGSRVISAADTEPTRLARIHELFPALECYCHAAEVINDPRIHAVVIATPLNTHHGLVREALLAGKHVLSEKPLCNTGTQAADLIDLARGRNLILMVGHVFLFNPGIIRIQQMIRSGDLGTMHYMHAVRTNLGPIRDDCNVAFDLATHDISIFNWLIGSQPLEVSATGASFLQAKVEDVVSISLRYPNQVFATILASWLNPKKVRQITIVGSKQMVTWDDLQLSSPVACFDKGANSSRQYDDFGEFLRISTWDGDVKLPRVPPEEPLKLQARYFLEAVRTGVVEKSGAESAMGVMKTLDAVSISLSKNGQAVEVCP